MYTEEQLLKMNEARLAALAADEFALELPKDFSKSIAVQMILAAQADDAEPPTVVSSEPEPEPEPEPELEVPAPEPKARKAKSPVFTRAKIIVHNQEGPDNTPFIKVGLNGEMYQIPREVECVVPMGVVNVLNDAAIESWEPAGTDRNGEREYSVKHTRRHPFSVLERLP